MVKLSRRRIVLLMLGGVLAPAVLIYADVQRCRCRVCPALGSAPARPVAVVFGAAGDVLSDRVQTAVDLYKAGKVQKLLMTGDNAHLSYNEPQEMKRQALRLGVPAKDIACDYAGFRTYDSLYRARDIFGVRSAILVTQGYHLPRALFLAQRMGIEAVGVDAARRSYAGQRGFDLREIAATEVAWVQGTLTRPRPKFLGKPEPLMVGR